MRARPLVVVVLLLTAGCSSGFSVDTYPTAPGTAVDCGGLFADSPPTVAGQSGVRVKGQNASAWGDPAIILRCGVEAPEGLGPGSRCDMVNDVGWFAETTADGYVFTTIGRRFFISVEIPKKYDPAADALVDVADAIGRHDPVVKACV